MKRLNKKDFIYLAISIISFILLVLLVTDNTFLYASSTNQEYINYANYLRNLFYDTKDILPDFALSINNGISYPFADRLVEYLFKNAIVPTEKIEKNIGRVQEDLVNLHNFSMSGMLYDI